MLDIHHADHLGAQTGGPQGSTQPGRVKAAKLVAGVMQGAGSGFEFVLRKRKTHYFVCGERGGIHCTMGQMKFTVKPKSSACRD